MNMIRITNGNIKNRIAIYWNISHTIRPLEFSNTVVYNDNRHTK